MFCKYNNGFFPKRERTNKPSAVQQWSSSLRRGWQNCSERLRRLFFGYVSTYYDNKKSACVLFLIWPRDPLYYQISLFLSIFWNFEADLMGFIHTLKMFKNTFLLKIYQKLPKNLTFTLICSDDQGGLVTPSDHCALSISNVKIQ